MEGWRHKGQIRGLKRAGEGTVETKGRSLGDGIRLKINSDGGQVGTRCLHSRRNGCFSKVGYRHRLVLNRTKLGLSFNLFFVIVPSAWKPETYQEDATNPPSLSLS